LLQLYTEPITASLSDALTASTSSPNPLDYALSWHLFSALDAFGVIPKPRDDYRLQYNLTLSYASVLEFVGLWEWAIYVVLHLPDSDEEPYLREGAIKHILSRQVPAFDDANRHFLTHQLHIPIEWIREAEGPYHVYHSDYEAAIRCFLECHDWDTAAGLLRTHCAWPLLLHEFHDAPDGTHAPRVALVSSLL